MVLLLSIVSFPPLPTGQTHCYNNTEIIPCHNPDFPQQDADNYQPLLKNRYKELSKNSILDQITHLIWMKYPAPKNKDWQGAINYCQNLKLDHRHWTLPHILELNSLVEIARKDFKINTDFFKNSNTINYWTAYQSKTNKIMPAKQAWFINFKTGAIFDMEKSNQLGIRCVSKP